MLVSELLTAIRDTLSDNDAERWSDKRIIREINSAAKHIVRGARNRVATYSYSITPNVVQYILPSTVISISSAEYSSKNIAIRSTQWLNEHNGTDWRLDTGDEVEAIVFDERNSTLLYIYPILENPISSGINGAIVSISDTDFTAPYGAVVSLSEFSNDTQEVTDNALLRVTCVDYAPDVEDITDELDLSEACFKAIKYYACGHILKDDRDTQNRQFGAEELLLYGSELKELTKLSSADYTKTNQYFTEYKGGINGY